MDSDASNIAAHVEDFGNKKVAVVYDVDKLSAAATDGKLDVGAGESYVVGFVEIGKPRGAECRGAWQIKGIVGPGKTVYGLAYALSPTGMIVPDRSEVSPSASAAWKGYAAKAAKTGDMLPLDDADHPKKGTDPFHDKHHTDDPGDDCYTSHEEPYLNAAYRGQGGETALLDRLQDAHQAAMQRISGESGMTQEELETGVLNAGYSRFDRAMGY